MSLKLKDFIKAKTIIVLFAMPFVFAQSNNTSFTDSRDDRTYRIVKIENLTWLAENLNFNHASGNSWCYDYDESNCNTHGRLYTWDAAMESCVGLGDGWRLPTGNDWEILNGAVGDWRTAGTKLKARTGWQPSSDTPRPNIPIGTDEFGFSALPGGYGPLGPDGSGGFNGMGSFGLWWTADMVVRGRAQIQKMDNNTEVIQPGRMDTRRVGLSVRCVRDD